MAVKISPCLNSQFKFVQVHVEPRYAQQEYYGSKEHVMALYACLNRSYYDFPKSVGLGICGSGKGGFN
jgi:hypothetical protein